jgi:hypothetical protein
LPSNVVLSSSSPTCTPNPTCSTSFTYDAATSANKTSTSTINGAPVPVSPQNFTFTSN